MVLGPLTLLFLLAAGAPAAPIQGPVSSVFDVTAYGAVGDGVHNDTKAIRLALEAAAKAAKTGKDPAVVHVPAEHTFLTGPLNLSSFVTLQVDGTLKAISGNNTAGGEAYIADGGWPQIPPLPSYGNSRDGPYLQYQAFIFAWGVSDVAITGSGTIDGQGDWWSPLGGTTSATVLWCGVGDPTWSKLSTLKTWQ